MADKKVFPPGHLNGEDEKFMKSFAQTFLSGNPIMVELGSYKGRSACCWLEGLKEKGGKIITIDNHRDCDLDCEFTGTDYVKRMNEWGYLGRNNIHIIGDITEVSKFFNMEIDALFIDALHTYEAVQNDFNNWSKFVKLGGFVIFHDYNASFEGVTRFCNELKENKDWEFIKQFGQCALFKRVNK